MPRKVVVVWEDAYSPARDAYTSTSAEVAAEYRPHILETIGYIAYQDKHVVSLARDLFNGRYRDFMYIPRGMVQKIRTLR